MLDEWVALCALDDIPFDSSRGFDLSDSGRDDLFIVRSGAGLFAYRNYCPHQGATMPWRRHAYLNAARNRIVCSAHGAEFDIQTGQGTSGAALGLCLNGVAVRVSNDEVIEVRRQDLPDTETGRD